MSFALGSPASARMAAVASAASRTGASGKPSNAIDGIRTSRSRSARVAGIAAATSSRRLIQVLSHIPGPELDQVAVRIVYVSGAAGALEGRLLDVEALAAQLLDRRVVVGVGDLHRVVDVLAAAAAVQPGLRPPQPDAGALAGHHPDRLALRPAVHDREAEGPCVERLGAL